ncbi:Zinc finger, C2H2 [Lasallia pustulata]|uniref:Zinc finger, C2H2 n=1 Tax=Lasallia pustulata TaxID=136370 RepID=A0A1W5D9J8_9LECA|nr:Zinc finger, C2H2 [Lasallia pustulata]
MPDHGSELLKRPLYVFDLPTELLATLHLKSSSASQHSTETETVPHRSDTATPAGTEQLEGTTQGTPSCVLCGATFLNVQEQRRHVKSDWHSYNLKQKLKGLKSATENEFEKLVGDLNESISGSESSSESDRDTDTKDSTLTALLKKQAKIKDEGYFTPKKPKRGAGKQPLWWFSTPLLPTNTSLGIYRALFTDAEQEEESRIVDVLRGKQLLPTPTKPSPHTADGGVQLPSSLLSPQIFLCMIGGGHFAAMIVSLAPKMGKKATGVEERQATVIAHKTFHRYTTRRKQGGSQSANDSAKGPAHSAGSSLRRYNELALETEIRALLGEWKSMIDQSQLVFIRATSTTNRRTLFGPYDNQVLRHNDPRNRSFPFSTRRATQAELMRAFVELTRVKISQVDEAALAAAAAAEEATKDAALKTSSTPAKPLAPKPSKEEESASLHTSQLQALIRRSKAPAVLSYISSNTLSPDFVFHPASTQANHHAPTPLHLAASINSPAVILALLTKAGANPTNSNGEGKPPFDLTGDRASRDAFRVARSELGEDRWDWNAAHVPPAISKAEADKREERERLDAEKAEMGRRNVETERLRRETEKAAVPQQGRKPTGRALAGMEKTGAERREEEARGMTPEMRARLERERRARAAEERIRRMAGGVPGGGAGI